MPKPKIPGVLKGLGVTAKTMAETIFPDGPGGIAVHSVNVCIHLHPVSARLRPSTALDAHHGGAKWVRTIPAGLDPYVVRCLQGAGLAST